MNITQMNTTSVKAWGSLRKFVPDSIRAGDDSGTTLMELVVAMTLMVIFGSIFTAAIFLMYGDANKVEAITTTTSQVNTAFLRLDKLVRYASGISTPGTGASSGDYYVEWSSNYTGSQVCTQLRVDLSSQQLQTRSWNVSGSTASGLTNWTPLVSNIANPTTASPTYVPFTLQAQSTELGYQQLTVNLAATSGSAQSTTSRSSVTFVALNSSSSATPSSVCQQLPASQERP